MSDCGDASAFCHSVLTNKLHSDRSSPSDYHLQKSRTPQPGASGTGDISTQVRWKELANLITTKSWQFKTTGAMTGMVAQILNSSTWEKVRGPQATKQRIQYAISEVEYEALTQSLVPTNQTTNISRPTSHHKDYSKWLRTTIVLNVFI